MRFKETSAVHGGIEDSMGASEGGRPYRRDGYGSPSERHSRTRPSACPAGSRPVASISSGSCAGSPDAWRSGTRTNAVPSALAGRSCTAPSSRPSGTGSSTRPPTAWRSTTKTCSRDASGRSGRLGDIEAPAPVAQGRPRHRPVRRGDDRNRRGGNHAAGRGRRRAAQRAGRASGSDAARAAEHPAHPLRERTPYSKAWPGDPVE